MKLLKQFIQQETVLTAAAVLAVVSAFFVPPDVQYLGYIDLRTLAILFSLMTVMAGLRRQGFFDGLGREVLVAVLASQVTSNVPAALLLSGFTAETQALIIGTNLGGLGTLIASMASLISYRQIARELPQGKKQYFGLFTLSNLIFLAILLGVWFLLR